MSRSLKGAGIGLTLVLGLLCVVFMSSVFAANEGRVAWSILREGGNLEENIKIRGGMKNAEYGGKQAVVLPLKAEGRNLELSFALTEEMVAAIPERSDIWVTIEYYAIGAYDMVIAYPRLTVFGELEAYIAMEDFDKLKVRGTGEWKTHTWHLTRCMFPSLEKISQDKHGMFIALNANQDKAEVIIRKIAISTVPPEDIPFDRIGE